MFCLFYFFFKHEQNALPQALPFLQVLLTIFFVHVAFVNDYLTHSAQDA